MFISSGHFYQLSCHRPGINLSFALFFFSLSYLRSCFCLLEFDSCIVIRVFNLFSSYFRPLICFDVLCFRIFLSSWRIWFSWIYVLCSLICVLFLTNTFMRLSFLNSLSRICLLWYLIFIFVVYCFLSLFIDIHLCSRSVVFYLMYTYTILCMYLTVF